MAETTQRIRLETGIMGHARPGGGRRRYSAVFVQAGPARAAGGEDAGLEITPAALEQAVQDGLFNARAAFVDHAALWEHPSLDHLAGVTGAAYWDGQAVRGEIELYNTQAGQAATRLLDELLEQGALAPDIGLSLSFFPELEVDPRSGRRRVTAIQHVESIDLVFEPAAGGRILAMLSSSNLTHTTIQEVNMNPSDPIQADPTAPPGAPTAPPGALSAVEGRSSPDDSASAYWQSAIAEAGAQALINLSGLPEVARRRLSGQDYAGPWEVQQAIELERAYLAALQETSVIQIGSQPPRAPHITNMRTSLDQVSMALEALLAGVRPAGGVQPLTGIRELYHLLSGDYELSGVYQPERVTFANVNSSTMAAMVANAMNKRLAAEFQQYPQWWAPVVNIEDFSSLQDARWITLGGVGELPTVAEGASYTELTWDDKTETSAFVKKGGYLGLTIEAIDKDDVGRLRAAPRALAQAAWLTLSKAISAIFTSNSGAGPTLSDSVALFHASHGNLGSSALSMSTYAAARLAMRKQTELNSGERLGALTAPKYLLVPPDLEITALQILGSETDYTYALSNGVGPGPGNAFTDGDTLNARMQFARARVIVVDLWTDSNDWAAAADPRMYPTIGLGFRYGRAPEIFSVASPTAGLMFSNDTMPVKVRFFFAVGPADYRGLYKANV